MKKLNVIVIVCAVISIATSVWMYFMVNELRSIESKALSLPASPPKVATNDGAIPMSKDEVIQFEAKHPELKGLGSTKPVVEIAPSLPSFELSKPIDLTADRVLTLPFAGGTIIATLDASGDWVTIEQSSPESKTMPYKEFKRRPGLK